MDELRALPRKMTYKEFLAWCDEDSWVDREVTVAVKRLSQLGGSMKASMELKISSRMFPMWDG